MFFGECEKSIPLDTRNVLDAAAVLQVTEFHLFQIAYRHWYGRHASERSIERFFVPYMFRSVVPYWVRQLCRRVLRASAEGKLNPAEFGLERNEEEHAPHPSYLRFTATFGAVIGMLVIAASLYLAY